MLTLRKRLPVTDHPWKIPLGHGVFTLVDKETYVLLSNWKWHLRKSKYGLYVCRKKTIKGEVKLIRIHRQIMQCPPEFEVHHINGDPLDNRMCNLEMIRPDEHRHYKNFYRTEE